MGDAIISVESVSKRYVINHQRSKDDGLRHAIEEAVRAPLRFLKGRQKNNNGHEQSREEFWALKDISFKVNRGDVVGIIGRNGAGKSTLLKILSRITEPTSGRIEINGVVSSLLEVGTGFHPDLTGRENIFLNGAILGMSSVEIKRKLDEIVAFSEVERFLDTPVKRYSSGMQMRLAFAVAAHLEPEILIVDEVLAVGDASFQKKCIGKMKDVATGGRTVLFVSHNSGAVRSLCNTCLLLSKGTLAAAGEVDDILAKYLTISNPGSADLKANELFALTRCDLMSWDSDEPTTNPVFGKNYTLKLAFESFRNTRFAINIEICDQNGVLLSSIASPEEGYEFLKTKGCYTYDIDLLSLPLHPGTYSIRVRFGDERETFFGQEDAIIFSVEPQHLGGAAWSYNRRHGFVRIAAESRLQKVDESLSCV